MRVEIDGLLSHYWKEHVRSRPLSNWVIKNSSFLSVKQRLAVWIIGCLNITFIFRIDKCLHDDDLAVCISVCGFAKTFDFFLLCGYYFHLDDIYPHLLDSQTASALFYRQDSARMAPAETDKYFSVPQFIWRSFHKGRTNLIVDFFGFGTSLEEQDWSR